MTSKEKGDIGEAKAQAYLEKKGYETLCKNYRCRFGEIDLIMKNKAILIFVEVKKRKNDHFATAAAAVTPQKQQKILKTAQFYLAEQGFDGKCRFDVVEVYGDEQNVTLQHMERAFDLW